MLPVVYRKIVMGLVLAGIVVAMPDLVFELLHSIAHVSYEWISFILEEFIGNIFHLGKYQRQLIAFIYGSPLLPMDAIVYVASLPGSMTGSWENC